MKNRHAIHSKDLTFDHTIKSHHKNLELTMAVAASTFLKITCPVVFKRFSFPWITDSSLKFFNRFI
jgi:hypothetical protein